LSQSLADAAKANANVEKMCAAQAESEKATLTHILRVRELLTPSQQERYAALINDQLCTACPMGMHTQ
jgi:Spy/CpxP family protein refolding chaperone